MFPSVVLSCILMNQQMHIHEAEYKEMLRTEYCGLRCFRIHGREIKLSPSYDARKCLAQMVRVKRVSCEQYDYLYEFASALRTRSEEIWSRT